MRKPAPKLKTTNVNIRVLPKDLKRWKARASKTLRSLTMYVTDTLNAESGGRTSGLHHLLKGNQKEV